MDEQTKKKISERIMQVTKEREDFLQQANRQLVAYQAVIDELNLLLKEPEPEPPVPEQEKPAVKKK